jgi:pyruvate dehydrogenase E2 component (dihydrolipoamide acetyltransferase)
MKADIRRFADESRVARPAEPAAAEPPDGKAVTYEELSQIRKTIAARMVQSKQTAPHLTAMEKVEVSELVALRERSKESFLAAAGVKLTYLPFVIKAVCAGLAEHPVLNGRLELDRNRFVKQNFINIGVAVDSPDGLIVPVIRDADRKSIRGIAAEVRDLAERARERKLTLEEIRGGTFSITNYGAIAGTYGVPIINYPEVAILGVGRIADEPVVRDGEIVPGKVLRLSLSADHRIVDGAEAARFIKRVMELLADPAALLLA